MKLWKIALRMGLWSLAFIMAMSLAACSSTPEREVIEITLMHGYGGSSLDHVNMRKIYEDFSLENPDVKVILDSSPDLPIIINKANDKLAAGRMPDIISTNGESRFLSNAIIRGKALNLKPYIDADEEFRNDIHPSILKAWMKDDAIYTLPNVLEIIGYWYNEEILREAGVTTDGTPYTEVKLPAAWEEFWEACDKIVNWAEEQQNGVKPLMMGSDQSLNFLGARIAGENKAGTEFMKKRTIDFNTPEFIKAMDALRKAYSYSDHSLVSRNDIFQQFKSSKLAFFFSGVWESNDLAQSKNHEQIKYAAFPGYDGLKVSYESPSSGYVIGNTGDPKKIEASVRFLKYLLSDEVQKRMVEETYQAPSNPHIDLNWIKQVSPMLGMALSVARESEIHIWTLESLWDEKAIEMLKNNLNRVINKTMSPLELSDLLHR
ncbi:extracellular solute-binding protein [Paenibacillus sp. LHD-38]|uniref:ABC transporter substrate-binding protein n=1 Tax=Paenibacillus sp. LHD-38 TaxID=3072143 RepID=UPI00280E1368|nr:extracellular solute-binding protein [Paenibacillus sp. LHD-38]MDQ8734789.1 extracellular solute-binding protein [Paenibacillus sp. LHD-38]